MFAFLALIFALAPTYILRFKLGLIPLNVLELLILIFWVAFIVWLWKKKLFAQFKDFILNEPKAFLIFWALFMLAGIISMLISPARQHAQGMFLVLFFLPMLTYFPAKFLLRDEDKKRQLVDLIFILVAVVSIYGIFQYFTLFALPPQWWGNANEPKRAISFFEHPNGFALYLTPLLAFLLPFVAGAKQKAWHILCFIAGLAGLIFTLSRGGWIGFIAAAAVFIIFWGNKKIRTAAFSAFVVAAVVVALVPNFRYRVILPFQGEKSTVSRFSLWHTAEKMISDSPILGKGLYGFQTDFNQYNTDPNLAPINHPHNIFMMFWVETGLLGLVSFVAIALLAFWRGVKQKTPYGIGVALFLLALFIHGQADSPYIMNDLALIYWIILAL